MNRRTLLQSLVAVPFIRKTIADKNVDAVKLQEKSKYVVFFDERVLDVEGLMQGPVAEDDPLAGALLIPLCLAQGSSVSDAVAIYKLDDGNN
jgi:hypothetical protein